MSPQRKGALLVLLILIVITTIIVQQLLGVAPRIDELVIGPSGQTIEGEVWGGFEVNGSVRTDQRLDQVGFLFWTYDADDNVSSSFSLRVWNVSRMMVWCHENGSESRTNYTMSNETLTVVGGGNYFTGRARSARLLVNYSEISAFNDDGFFERNQNWSYLRCAGELDHGDDVWLDFFLNFCDVRIGNETFHVGTGRFAFPDDEYARFELVSRGRGLILPTPTLTVDGEVRFNDFRQTHGDWRFYRVIDHLVVRSGNVTVATSREPDCDVRDHETDVYIVKWAVRVRASKP